MKYSEIQNIKKKKKKFVKKENEITKKHSEIVDKFTLYQKTQNLLLGML